METLVRERWRDRGGIRALGREIGVSRTTIYSWFRGASRPSAVHLARLSDLLGVSSDDLLELLGAGSGGPERSQAQIGSLVSEQEVLWCNASDPVGPVAETMVDEHYSQVPVREGDRWVGLLTSEAMTRWSTARSRHGLGTESATPVREVMAHADHTEDFIVVSPDAALASVVNAFHQGITDGSPLAAALIVDINGELAGVVTPWDMAAVSAARARRNARQGS